MAAVAREQGITIDRICQIKEKGLRRLRTGKAKRELLEKFDIVEAGAYRNSMNKFNEHGFTSTVEYIALRRAELQAEYEKHIRLGRNYAWAEKKSVCKCSKIDKNLGALHTSSTQIALKTL